MTTKTEEAAQKMVEEIVTIPKLEIQVAQLKIVGDSPLIMHKWSEKAIKQIQDKQGKKPVKGREKRNPQQEYKDSMYKFPGGGYGFPATGFKASAVRGAKSVGTNMTDARASFYVVGTGPDQLVKIEGKPKMRTDMVRLAKGGSADVRYRGMFEEWSATLTVRYNAMTISVGQIINFFNVAGFGTGVGEWRSERDGQFGMFHVELSDEV